MTHDIFSTYQYKTKPYDHQIKAFEMSKDRKAFGLFMDMGTGKSKVAIDTAAHLYLEGEINTVVIFGNKGSYLNWVTDHGEIETHLPEYIDRFVAYWQQNPTRLMKASYDMMTMPMLKLKIFVMNIEAIAFPKAYEVVEAIIANNKTMLIVDESTTIKNEGAGRTKAAIKLGQKALFKRILTGEPTANSPLDIWAQAKFLDPNLLGFSSYFAFRSNYAQLRDIRVGYRIIKKVSGFRNMKQLAENIATWSYRIKKEDCLDLPPKIYQTRTIEMTPEQEKHYKALKEQSITELDELSFVTTTIAITKLLRLHQLACGHLVDDLGKVVEIKNNRLDSLMDTIAEAGGKILIWANYRSDIMSITKALAKEYGEDSVVSYFGDTDNNDRLAAVQGIQDANSPVRFFVGNPKTGGYGITLTGASTVMYYSNNFELDARLQSEDRAHRIGQTRAVTYIDFITKGTVDEKIVEALRGKRKISSELLGDTWREWI